jgi:protein AATF/BFR2
MEIPLASLKRKREDDMEEWIESTYQDILVPLDTGFKSYRNQIIDKWNTKTQLADGIPLQKKFKVINQSLVSQIENAFANREKLVKKSKLNRSNYQILGRVILFNTQKQTPQNIEDETRDTHLNDYDENIYDDGDYYQQLLKEFIDTRMQDTNDPTVLAMRFAKMKQLQKKKSSREIVDTKASKGRKIRYQVQEKIQNFMAPEPRGTWHDEMCQELFANLLGNVQEVKMDSETITLNDGFRVL